MDKLGGVPQDDRKGVSKPYKRYLTLAPHMLGMPIVNKKLAMPSAVGPVKRSPFPGTCCVWRQTGGGNVHAHSKDESALLCYIHATSTAIGEV
jgi:hypothetical protein